MDIHVFGHVKLFPKFMDYGYHHCRYQFPMETISHRTVFAAFAANLTADSWQCKRTYLRVDRKHFGSLAGRVWHPRCLSVVSRYLEPLIYLAACAVLPLLDILGQNKSKEISFCHLITTALAYVITCLCTKSMFACRSQNPMRANGQFMRSIIWCTV